MFARRFTLAVLVVVILLLVANGAVVYGAGVRPLVIEMNVRPGDEQEFELNLTPGETQELVDLTLYEPIQQLNGGLIYQLPANPAFSAASWVTLDNETVRVIPGEETKVIGRVKVPFSASGSHTVIVMVEPRPPEITTGIGFQVRYAVRLSIRVERAGVRPSAEIALFEAGPNPQGAPQLTAYIQNTSALDYLVSGEVTIRDQNKRLVERVTLRTSSGSAASDATRIYPGAKVQFTGEITRPLVPGEYSLQVFFRYGESGQLLRNETFTVLPDEYVFPGFAEHGPLVVTPTVVEHNLRPGERKSQVFEFESMAAEPVQIEIATGEIFPDYQHSLTKWVELRSQNKFILPGRARTRLAMTIAAPRDGADGSYHGLVKFKTTDPITGQLLAETIVPLNVLIGTEHRHDIEVRSIGVEPVGDDVYLALDLFNRGNITCRPQVAGMILDEAGEFVAQVAFEQMESNLLPLQAGQITAITSQLEPGDYLLELEIKQDGLETLTEKLQFSVNK